LPAETLQRLSERMTERTFARREVVVKKGEPALIDVVTQPR
jgi:hypothetical protein